jgi:hypothetical protein
MKDDPKPLSRPSATSTEREDASQKNEDGETLNDTPAHDTAYMPGSPAAPEDKKQDPSGINTNVT